MRSFVRRVLVLGGCVVATVVASGCEGKQATEYVAGVSTQVTVPRDLTALRINISVGGLSVFCKGFQVFNGKVLLPRSLGAFAQSDSAANGDPITFEVVGLTTANLDSQFFASCGLSSVKVKQEDVRVLRRSRQPYEPNVIKFLPMPIKYSCFDKDCGDEQTCKGGKCVPMDTPKESLPEYTPDLVDGTGASCFRVKNVKKPNSNDVDLVGCMEAVVQPIPVNADDCLYAVPGTPDAPPPKPPFPDPFAPIDSALWKGVNVEVSYDAGLTKEILDKDPEEGFSIPDPTKPQQFKLAPGLCEMVKGVTANPRFGQKIPDTEVDEPQFIPTEHRITSIRVSGTCQSKLITQPFCDEDQQALMGQGPEGPNNDVVCQTTELVSPQSALVVVVDNTTTHQRFFDKVKVPYDPNDTDTTIEPAIRSALSDPAFRRTDMGLLYSPGTLGCATTGAFDLPLAPAIDPGDGAQSASEKFLASIKTQPTVADEVKLEGSLARAYAELQLPKYKDYYRRAVLVLANSEFSKDDSCVGDSPVLRAQAALQTDALPKVSTYVMQLLKDPGKDPTADELAAAGGTTAAAWKTDEAQSKFSEIVNSLATCVYDLDVAPAPTDKVAFTSPLTSATTSMTFNSGCSTEGAPGDGWGIQAGGEVPAGKTRVHLCANSCTAYRDLIKQTSAFAAVYQQDPLPVPVYRYKATCGQ